MFARLSSLLKRKRPTPARRPAPTRLRCEALETREVLSATGEFLVNAPSSRAQFEPASATSADGSRSVVVWTHQNASSPLLPSNTDIRAQVYAGEQKVGGEIQVSYDYRNEHAPSVGMDDDGNFWVAWTLDYSSTDKDVKAARFSRDGARLGDTTVAGGGLNEYDPDVAVSGDGSFVVAYTYDYSPTDQDVYAGVFAADGSALETIRVAASGAPERNASVAVNGSAFVVAYQGLGHFNWGYGETYVSTGDIYASGYSYGPGYGDYSATYTDQRVDVFGRDDANPDVALNTETGEAIVAYQSSNGSNWDIRARVVGTTGFAGGTEYLVAGSSANETNPSIALQRGTNGPGVIAWQSPGLGGSPNIFLREDPFGGGTAVQLIASGTSTGVGAPSVCIDGSGHYLVNYAYTYSVPYYYYNGGQDVYGRFGQL